MLAERGSGDGFGGGILWRAGESDDEPRRATPPCNVRFHLNSGRTAAVLGATILAIALLIWAGVHNMRDRKLAEQQPQVVLVPKSAAEKPGAATSPDADQGGPVPALQGKIAPAFTLVDLDGKKVSLAQFKGKPVMVNFWATWCAPCKLEMPWLEEFHQKYGPSGLVILGIAADDAGKTVIANTAKKLGVTYPILLADGTVQTAYGGVDYMPESFYVGRDGKVMLQTAGIDGGQGGKDEMEANVKKLVEAGQ